jgi:hypothetical protein
MIGHGTRLSSIPDASRRGAGLLIEAGACLFLAVFKPGSIASIGSAVALLIFTLITAAHFRVRSQTRASPAVLVFAILAADAGASHVRVHRAHP